MKGAFINLQKTREMCWSGRRDLNSGPPAPKAGALPGCATPRHEVRTHYKALPTLSLAKTTQFGLQLCQNCARILSLNHGCARIHARIQRHFVCPPVDFLQSFSFHLQLHLRILFEDVRVALPKQLDHPLVGDSACA